MSVVAAQLVAEVSVSGAEKAKSDLTSVGETTTQTGGIFKNMLGGALSLATGVAGQAFSFLKDQLVDSVKVAMAHQDVMAQTTQAIKSTGDASGMTADAIDQLGESLSRTTDFSHDTTQAGENLLLTFTGIGKGVFPQTTQTMLDMAQAMHTGPTQEAMLLGKALNDPTQGLSALTRVGVTFSAQEKQQIQTMMAHNDVIGAQKVMLKELQTEFGGSAEAAGKTFGGALQILKNNLEDVKEHIGSAVLPVLGQMMSFVNSTILPGLEKLGGWLTQAGGLFSKFRGFVSDALEPFHDEPFGIFLGALQDVGSTLSSWFFPLIQQVGLAFKFAFGDSTLGTASKAISNFLAGGLYQLGDLLEHLKPIITSVARAFSVWMASGNLTQMLQDGAAGVRTLIGALGNLSFAGNLFDALSRHAQELGRWFQSSVVPAIRAAEPGFASLGQAIMGLLPIFSQIAEIVHTTFQKAFDALLPVFERIVPVVIYLSGLLAGALGQAITFLTPYVIQAAAALGQFVDQIAQRVLPIVNEWILQIHDFLIVWNAVWPYLAPILKGTWDAIVGIVKVAWALVSGIIKIGLDLMGGNWKQAWTDLKDMLGGVWDGIKQYIMGGLETMNGLFGGLPGKALQWGRDMIQGFIDGISQMMGSLNTSIGNIASTISAHLHFSKPDVGPLSTFDQWAPDMISLLAQGMNDNIGKIKAASLNVATTIATGTQPGLSGGLAALPQGASSGSPIQITVQSPDLTLDGRLLTNGLMPYIAGAIRQHTGARF